MALINEELLRMAEAVTTKQADGMGGGGTMAGGIPPMPQMPGTQPPAQDPNAQPAQPPQPGMGQVPGMDPMTAMMGSPQPQPQQAGPQKMKPEQMFQMIDMRMYNMQQQLTAIAHAVNAKIDMGALVLPPGMQGAPPAETAIPGGPMDPMQAPGAAPGGDPNAAAGGAPPGAPPGGAPVDPAAAAQPKMAADAWFAINGQGVATPVTVKAAGSAELAKQRERAAAVSHMIRSSYANSAP